MLKKLYTELHTVIQTSEDLSKRFPALAQGVLPQIPAVSLSPAGSGAAMLGPVHSPSIQEQAKPLIKKALQMTGTSRQHQMECIDIDQPCSSSLPTCPVIHILPWWFHCLTAVLVHIKSIDTLACIRGWIGITWIHLQSEQ